MRDFYLIAGAQPFSPHTWFSPQDAHFWVTSLFSLLSPTALSNLQVGWRCIGDVFIFLPAHHPPKFWQLIHITFHRKNMSEYLSFGDDSWTVLIKHNCTWVTNSYQRSSLYSFEKCTKKIQLLENSCSTVLCWPLPHIITNQPQVHICPSLWAPSQFPAHSAPLGCHRTEWSSVLHSEFSWAVCLYTW